MIENGSTDNPNRTEETRKNALTKSCLSAASRRKNLLIRVIEIVSDVNQLFCRHVF